MNLFKHDLSIVCCCQHHWCHHLLVVASLLVSSSSLVSSSVYSCPSDSIAHRNFISCRYMYIFPNHHHWCHHLCTAVPVTALLIELHILQIHVHGILDQCDVYFWNGSHFNKILEVALLSTWLSLEPLYLAQLCIYTGATRLPGGKEYASANNLKIMIF